MRRELFLLLATVLVVDALFIAGYLLFRLAAADPLKVGYTVAWTVVTLLVVLRGLTRIRSLRRRGGT